MPNDIPNSTWNEIDASNTAPVPNGAPEGWFPSDVNNVYRMGMGATKRFWDHINVTETTGGTTTAYTLTYDVAPQQLWAGELFSFKVNATCGATPTLNVNSLGAKSLRRWNGSAWVALAAGEIVADQVLMVYYNSADTAYDIVGGFKDAAFSGGTLTSTTTMSGAAFNEAVRVDVASATTCDIGAAVSNYVRITGTTTITGLGTIASGARRQVVFAAALTLSHNATSLILPTGANITTAAGDCAIFESEGSGNWRCISYQRASGAPLIASSVTNSLGANVNMVAINTLYTGPSVAQGTAGTWYASGQIVVGSSFGGDNFDAILWDGTTVIDSCRFNTTSVGGGYVATASLSGVLASPAGNIRISVRCGSRTDNTINYDASSYSKDSTLTAIRIA